jgi:hypothetical protein
LRTKQVVDVALGQLFTALSCNRESNMPREVVHDDKRYDGDIETLLIAECEKAAPGSKFVRDVVLETFWEAFSSTLPGQTPTQQQPVAGAAAGADAGAASPQGARQAQNGADAVDRWHAQAPLA